MMLFTLYRFLIVLATPFIRVWLWVRLRRGKEDKNRFRERLGHAGRTRPKGKLVWMHGASVGECLSMMPLVRAILEKDAAAHVMVTSGTVSSAGLMAKRLPERAFHHYIPVDFPGAARRFVGHFKPDVALWFESDFWPNLLTEAHAAQVPLVLLNGRISDKSFRRWQRAPWFIRHILSLFSLTLGQTEEDARRLQVLGAREALCVGNLKFAAGFPPFDPQELKALRKQIGDRPCWCGACTHPSEEEMLADVHLRLKKIFPDILTVNVPRHPPRADEIEKMFLKKGLAVARRSRHESIAPQTDIYLADTIGEMGLLYQLAPVVFVGGSLISFGGQNMLEPMRLERTVIVGAHTFNFREIVARALQQGALVEVRDTQELFGNIVFFLKNPEARLPIQQQALALATSEMDVLDRLYRVLREKAGFK